MYPPRCGRLIQMLYLALLALISSSTPEATPGVVAAGSANVESSSSSTTCTPSMVWRHQSPSHLFAIKRQASCLFQGLMWEVGKKKETTHGLKVFERFADAAAAVNAALVEQGLEPLTITHSNVQSSGMGAAGSPTGGNNGLANRLQANAVRTGDVSAVAAEAAASAVAAALSASRPANTHHAHDRNVPSAPVKQETAATFVQPKTTSSTSKKVAANQQEPNIADLLPEDDKDIEPEQEEAAAARYEARQQQQQQQQQRPAEATVVQAEEPNPSSDSKYARISTSGSSSSSSSGTAKKSGASSQAVHKLLTPTAPHRDTITQLVVVGERNTGTNWLFRTLEENFNVTVRCLLLRTTITMAQRCWRDSMKTREHIFVCRRLHLFGAI